MVRLTAFLLGMACAGSAMACGNPLLWAMLFARVPEAKEVYDADVAARKAGALQARVFDASNSGMDYHRWSMAWLDEAARSLDASIVDNLSHGESVTILLADAVAAMHFEQGAAPKVISAAGLDFEQGFDAITTINALESGLNFGLSAEQMIKQGVLVPTEHRGRRVITGLF